MNTILIVDDNRDDVDITEIAIDEAGFEVKIQAAFSGYDALKYLQDVESMPALILLDLKMPGLSGIETLEKIRGDSRFNKIPVVVVTASLLPSDEEYAYAAGANGYLNKALDLKQFSKDIKTHLDRWVPK